MDWIWPFSKQHISNVEKETAWPVEKEEIKAASCNLEEGMDTHTHTCREFAVHMCYEMSPILSIIYQLPIYPVQLGVV